MIQHDPLDMHRRCQREGGSRQVLARWDAKAPLCPLLNPRTSTPHDRAIMPREVLVWWLYGDRGGFSHITLLLSLLLWPLPPPLNAISERGGRMGFARPERRKERGKGTGEQGGILREHLGSLERAIPYHFNLRAVEEGREAASGMRSCRHWGVWGSGQGAMPKVTTPPMCLEVWTATKGRLM